MRKCGKIALGVAAAAIVWSAPASAQATGGEAELLRRLDIMLMVTSLRCRHGSDDFQPEYRRFSARHLSTMNAAGRELHAQYALRHGERGAGRQVDHLSTGMANHYGRGHPWLECRDLRAITRNLAETDNRSELLGAAREYLEDHPRQADRLVARYSN